MSRDAKKEKRVMFFSYMPRGGPRHAIPDRGVKLHALGERASVSFELQDNVWFA